MKKIRLLNHEEAQDEQLAFFLSLSVTERIAELQKLRLKVLGPPSENPSKKIQLIRYKE